VNQAKTFLFMALLSILFVWLGHLISGRQGGGIAALFRAHPSTNDRIRRLERMTE